ncbi:Transmembrane protein [Pseudolycoriella hygida]|uniref:Transmembrane protein 192 n=1 Tax=Pseudolycoriella hygida TaxID=35572 RepID=A0A9Q0RUR5_9DIPT|nr:Transmembrane protein [Pseudolycoriella hygida]
MVSLGSNINSGGRFFEHSNMDDQFLEPILAEDEPNFKPLKTVFPFSFHLFVSSLISLVGIVLAACWKDDRRCEAYFIMLYLRVAFWLITFIFDHFVKYHHENLRMKGYHDFYRATNVHKGIPLYIVSLWNTTIMAVQTLIQHYYGTNFGYHCVQVMFSPIVYITVFSCLETILFVIVHGSYITKVVYFNRLQPAPDAMACGGSHSIGVGSVGLTQRGANVAELLEKQADLINYLQDHNDKLNQTVMRLNSELATCRSPLNTFD